MKYCVSVSSLLLITALGLWKRRPLVLGTGEFHLRCQFRNSIVPHFNIPSRLNKAFESQLYFVSFSAELSLCSPNFKIF